MKKAIIHQHYPLDYAGEEALNSICTNLAFIGTDKRKIVITSNSQSEGKSWMTMHIAENMARRGRHVVLVDADMRRSFMVQRYKLELEGEGLGLAACGGVCAPAVALTQSSRGRVSNGLDMGFPPVACIVGGNARGCQRCTPARQFAVQCGCGR